MGALSLSLPEHNSAGWLSLSPHLDPLAGRPGGARRATMIDGAGRIDRVADLDMDLDLDLASASSPGAGRRISASRPLGVARVRASAQRHIAEINAHQSRLLAQT